MRTTCALSTGLPAFEHAESCSNPKVCMVIVSYWGFLPNPQRSAPLACVCCLTETELMLVHRDTDHQPDNVLSCSFPDESVPFAVGCEWNASSASHLWNLKEEGSFPHPHYGGKQI